MRSKLFSIFFNKCPRCREGNLFTNPNPYNLKHVGHMPINCQVCGQDFRIEPGFYFGAAYVSYGINVALFFTTFVLTIFVFGLNRIQFTVILLVEFFLLIPIIFRLSRSMWLHMFVTRK